MTDHHDENTALSITKTLENMMVTIGRQISNQYHVDAKKVSPDSNGEISDTIKPIMKVAKDLFKNLLAQNFDSKQLVYLESVFNKKYLENLKAPNHSGAQKGVEGTFLNLGVQLLMNIGIPMLKNLMGHVAKHQKKAENKEMQASVAPDKKVAGYHAAHKAHKAEVQRPGLINQTADKKPSAHLKMAQK